MASPGTATKGRRRLPAIPKLGLHMMAKPSFRADLRTRLNQLAKRSSKNPKNLAVNPNKPPKLMLEKGLPGQNGVNHGRPLDQNPTLELLSLFRILRTEGLIPSLSQNRLPNLEDELKSPLTIF